MSYKDSFKETSFNAILPNLKYKNKKIYVIFKDPLKIIKNNEIKYLKEYYLGDISLTGKIYCMGIEINCNIIEKEHENGLEVNIKYLDNPNINRDHMKKFARCLEAKILDINIEDDDDESQYSEEFNFEEEYRNKFNTKINEYNDEYDEYDEYGNINNNVLKCEDNELNDIDYTKYTVDKFKDNL